MTLQGSNQGSGFRVQGSEKKLSPVPCPLSPETAFTFIEVLMAVAILSVGITGILRGYATSIDVLERGQENIEAFALLKEKMAEIEEESIEDNGISPGTSKGKFKDTFKDYSWELNVKEIPPEYREGEEEIEISQKLNEVKLAVYRQGQSRKYYLTTYIISYDEEEEE